MKFTNTFLLIALLSFSITYSFEFASLAEVNELNSSNYGKSLLETVSLSLEQKGNLSEIQKLLNDLLFKLNSDQSKDDIRWAKEELRLDNKIKKLTKKIESLRKQILRQVNELARYIKLRDSAFVNLGQYKGQRDQNLKSLNRNKKRRLEDEEEFKKSQAEHTDVLNAIDAVLKQLRKLIGSISGKNRPSHIKRNAEENRDLKKALIQLSADEEQIQSFLETATEADQGKLQKLIDAFVKIKRSTQKSYSDDVSHDNRSKRTHKSLESTLKSDNRKLNRMIIDETRNYKSYVRRVNEITKNLGQLRKLRKAKKAEKKAAENEKDVKERKYKTDKAQRDEERRVIKKIQKIVKRRLANMSAYLNSKI